MSTERIEQFQTKGNRPSRWINRAESLLISAQILSEQSSMFNPGHQEEIPGKNSLDVKVFPVALMLRAMALECLLKSLWLKSGKELFIDGKYREPTTGTKPHDLLKLAEVIAPLHDFTVSDSEKKMLRRLTLFNTRGRYPSQRNWRINAPGKQPHGFEGPPTYWFPYEDEKLFADFVSKCKSHA